MKKLFIILIALVLMVVFYLITKNQQVLVDHHLKKLLDHSFIKVEFIRTGKELEVEVVNTKHSVKQGLSGRESIGSDGMLFIFPSASHHQFWMKEMKFNLDMIWLNDGVVVDVSHDVEKPVVATKLEDLKLISVDSVSDAVLEVRSGKINELGVVVGDRLIAHF